MSARSIRLHRVLRATPERIYRAFLDADAMAKWLPPNGFTGKVHQLDARVGGTYQMSFTNFTTKHSHSFGGEYVELVPFERIRYTDKFDDPNLPGAMQTTVSLQAGVLRDRVERRPGRHPRRDPAGGLLSRVAGIARAAGQAGRSRDPGVASPRMSDLGLTHIALPVRSLAASAAFYETYAGMEVVHRRHSVIWLSDMTRPFAIVLIETTSEVRPLLPIAHLGVAVESEEEVDRLCRLAREAGCLAREPEQSGPPVGYWALLRDPDGHTLEISHGQEVRLTVEHAG